MRPLKEKISITIDSDLLEKLREIADADCRPFVNSGRTATLARRFSHGVTGF